MNVESTAAMTLLLTVFLVSGAILIGVSIPLIQARVGPNFWYGFRVRRTLADPNVWYPANSYSGRRLFVVGVAEIVVATALYFVPGVDVAMYASIVGFVVVVALIMAIIQSFRYIRHLTKEDEAATR
jgi:hypothetical protein